MVKEKERCDALYIYYVSYVILWFPITVLKNFKSIIRYKYICSKFSIQLLAWY